MTAEVWSDEEAADYAIVYRLVNSGTAYRNQSAYALIKKLSNNLKGEIPVSADLVIRDGAVYEVTECVPISVQDVDDRIAKANEHLSSLHDLRAKVAAAEQSVQQQVSSTAAQDGALPAPDPNAASPTGESQPAADGSTPAQDNGNMGTPAAPAGDVSQPAAPAAPGVDQGQAAALPPADPAAAGTVNGAPANPPQNTNTLPTDQQVPPADPNAGLPAPAINA